MDEIRVSQEVETQKCAENFVYFCETYVKINKPTHGLINFILHPYQKRYVKALQDNRFLITNKFRQGGFSTLNCAWSLWKCMFSSQNNILFISKNYRESICCGNFATLMIDCLPDWLKPKLEKNNDHQKTFSDTGCKLFFCTPEAARGLSISHLFLEEAAFITNMDKYWKSVFQTIGTNGNCYVTSTPNGNKNPNGTKNWFHETYIAAEKLQNDFKVFHCDYMDRPDFFNEDWAAQNLGAKTPPDCQLFERIDLKIIGTIKSSGRYSDDLILSFSKGRICVNKVPTVIKEDDVINLYNGLFSLIGHEKAIDYAVNVITSKLDSLFMRRNHAESLDEKTLK